jgi:hypothetical protein
MSDIRRAYSASDWPSALSTVCLMVLIMGLPLCRIAPGIRRCRSPAEVHTIISAAGKRTGKADAGFGEGSVNSRMNFGPAGAFKQIELMRLENPTRRHC